MNILNAIALGLGYVFILMSAARLVYALGTFIRAYYQSYFRLKRFMSCLTPAQLEKATLGEKLLYWLNDPFKTYDHIILNNHRIDRDIRVPIKGSFPG
jgi:hypothetical protein